MKNKNMTSAKALKLACAILLLTVVSGLKCNKFSETEAKVEEACAMTTQVCVVTQAKGSGESEVIPLCTLPVCYTADTGIAGILHIRGSCFSCVLFYTGSWFVQFAETTCCTCAGGEALSAGMCQAPTYCDAYKTGAANQGQTDIVCNTCTTDLCNTKLPTPTPAPTSSATKNLLPHVTLPIAAAMVLVSAVTL